MQTDLHFLNPTTGLNINRPLWATSSSAMKPENFNIIFLSNHRSITHETAAVLEVMGLSERFATNMINYDMGCTSATHFY